MRNLVANSREIEVALGRAMARAKRQISTRTNEGRDVNEQPFKPYADSTKKQKIRTKRQTAPVNLTQTGAMLASITTRTRIEGEQPVGEIYFLSAKQGTKAAYNNETRKFFALSDKQLEEIQRAIDEVLLK